MGADISGPTAPAGVASSGWCSFRYGSWNARLRNLDPFFSLTRVHPDTSCSNGFLQCGQVCVDLPRIDGWLLAVFLSLMNRIPELDLDSLMGMFFLLPGPGLLFRAREALFPGDLPGPGFVFVGAALPALAANAAHVKAQGLGNFRLLLLVFHNPRLKLPNNRASVKVVF